MNKLKILLVLAAPIIFPSQAFAVDGLSANVSATNSYLWRGVEQTNGNSAISGGIDYAADSGFYVGTWTSNAEWDEGMTYEIDFYGGFVGETEHFSYDVGFIQYLYPDSTNDIDFSEVYANVTMGAFTLGYATLANAEGVDFSDDSYISLAADFEVANEIGIGFHIGKTTDDFYFGEDVVNYGASLSKNGFTFAVSKTDLDDDDVRVAVSYVIDIDL